MNRSFFILAVVSALVAIAVFPPFLLLLARVRSESRVGVQCGAALPQLEHAARLPSVHIGERVMDRVLRAEHHLVRLEASG